MPRLPNASFAPDCTITFDGDRVPARAGEPVAAALLAAGRVLVARSSKYHRPRGAFCLAGSCSQCLARVDGMPNQRICRTPCRPGLAIETQNTIGTARHDLLGVVDRVYSRGLDHHRLMTWNRFANRAAVAVSRQLAGLGKLPVRIVPPYPEARHDLLGVVDRVYSRGLDHHRLMTWNRFANRAAVAVSRQLAGLGKLPVRVVPPFPEAREELLDALVVGAGPAGLGAAEVLASAGLRVLLADQEPRVGGRLRCRMELPGEPSLSWSEDVSSAVARSGGEVALGAAVLGLWTDGGVCAALLDHRPEPRLRLVRPRIAVLATGTHAQPPAFEDADLPGVFAARGILVALAEHGTVPGARAGVLGEGREADAVAARLASAGMEVARAERAPLRAHGRGRLAAVELEGGGRVTCDTLAVATPRAPAAELPRLLGATLTFDGETGAYRLSGLDETRVAPGVHVAGELTDAMDAAQAAESGRRAAHAARAEARRG